MRRRRRPRRCGWRGSPGCCPPSSSAAAAPRCAITPADIDAHEDAGAAAHRDARAAAGRRARRMPRSSPSARPNAADEHVALLIGQPDGAPPLVRLHSECLTGDVLGSLKCDCGPQLHAALARDRGERLGHPALSAAGRARDRAGQQAARLCAAGPGVRHGRRQYAAGLRGRCARFRGGGADARAARAAPGAAADQQSRPRSRGWRRRGSRWSSACRTRCPPTRTTRAISRPSATGPGTSSERRSALIVVFGAAVRADGLPSPTLARRIGYAVAAARRDPRRRPVLLGRGSARMAPSEASVMARLLGRAIDPDRLHLDEAQPRHVADGPRRRGVRASARLSRLRSPAPIAITSRASRMLFALFGMPVPRDAGRSCRRARRLSARGCGCARRLAIAL